eukprot:g4077.t1
MEGVGEYELTLPLSPDIGIIFKPGVVGESYRDDKRFSSVRGSPYVAGFRKLADGGKYPAEKSGLIKVGHRLIAVNGIKTLSKTLEETMILLQRRSQATTIDINPLENERVVEDAQPSVVLTFAYDCANAESLRNSSDLKSFSSLSPGKSAKQYRFRSEDRDAILESIENSYAELQFRVETLAEICEVDLRKATNDREFAETYLNRLHNYEKKAEETIQSQIDTISNIDLPALETECKALRQEKTKKVVAYKSEVGRLAKVKRETDIYRLATIGANVKLEEDSKSRILFQADFDRSVHDGNRLVVRNLSLKANLRSAFALYKQRAKMLVLLEEQCRLFEEDFLTFQYSTWRRREQNIIATKNYEHEIEQVSRLVIKLRTPPKQSHSSRTPTKSSKTSTTANSVAGTTTLPSTSSIDVWDYLRNEIAFVRSQFQRNYNEYIRKTANASIASSRSGQNSETRHQRIPDPVNIVKTLLLTSLENCDLLAKSVLHQKECFYWWLSTLQKILKQSWRKRRGPSVPLPAIFERFEV